MKNPWTNLLDEPFFALSTDIALVEAFNARSSDRHKFDLTLLPEPYLGSLTATVVVLNLNPGVSPQDAEVHAQEEFRRRARLSLEHQLQPYPFLHLQPDLETPGIIWWKRRTRELTEDVGFQAVSNRLACIQYTAYHSKEYSKRSPLLPSQEYAFELVRLAMKRKAEIVVMRAKSLWMQAIPALSTYDHLHYASNPRSPYLSRGNLKSSYAAIARRLATQQ